MSPNADGETAAASADVVLQGNYNGDTWNTATNAYLRPYAAADRDVQETYFYIR